MLRVHARKNSWNGCSGLFRPARRSNTTRTNPRIGNLGKIHGPSQKVRPATRPAAEYLPAQSAAIAVPRGANGLDPEVTWPRKCQVATPSNPDSLGRPPRNEPTRQISSDTIHSEGCNGTRGWMLGLIPCSLRRRGRDGGTRTI